MKKIDSLTLLLWFFIFFILILFTYLIQLNKYVQTFSINNNVVKELQILNKEFDNFLLNQTTLINYDKINNSITKFDYGIIQLTIDDPSPHYKQLLQNITTEYNQKTSNIEYFKTENSQLLHSMHYLFDLNSVISSSKTLDTESIETANKVLLNLMRYYINSSLNVQTISADLKTLKSIHDDYLDLFVVHATINILRIKKFTNLKNKQNSDKMEIAIDALYGYLLNDYEKNIILVKSIFVILFTIAFFILFFLLIINKKSVNMKNELLGFKTAIENSYNSIVITDLDKNIIYVNDMAEKETGYSKEELIGKNPRVLKSGLNSKEFYQNIHTLLDAGKKWEGEFINKRKDDSLLYERASIIPIVQNNQIVKFLAIKLNITDYIKEKDKVEYMAYHDSLTSLPNRLSIEMYLKNRLPIAKRNNSKLAILFIDLDRFKTINDTLGHDVGDELLIEASKRIRNALRDSDMLARVGGDEFVIVIEAANSEYSAAHVCNNILKLFTEPIKTKSHLLNITLSIGVSVFPDDENNDYKKLFKYADIAMYQAKDSGKNTYRFYQKQLSVDAHNRLDLEQALKVVLDNSELSLVYQPKYNLKDQTVIGIEALVRWNSPTLGNVPPDKFIPVSEDTGFIIEIGLFIFEQSCKDFLLFQKVSKSLHTISINISAVQLYQDSFIEDILAITDKVGISTESIRLEITETHIMKNIKQSMEILTKLQKLGFSISIDDFGTGHSSLSYLKLFPIDELKIDKSFIDDLPHDKNDIAITKSIITLSSAMGYVNVAEGIENSAQEQFLLENNCHIGQGYYFCKPLIGESLINFLKEQNEK